MSSMYLSESLYKTIGVSDSTQRENNRFTPAEQFPRYLFFTPIVRESTLWHAIIFTRLMVGGRGIIYL